MPATLARVLLTVLALAALFATAPAASAHTVLTATDPSADSTVDAGPSRVTATFNEELQPNFVAMTVVGPDGNLWSQGDASVQGNTVSIGLRPPGPSGPYTVNYRVTSEDGHVVSGSWSFTVAVAGPGTPGAPVQAIGQRDRIPLWPFVVGATVLITGAAVWGLRRRS